MDEQSRAPGSLQMYQMVTLGPGQLEAWAEIPLSAGIGYSLNFCSCRALAVKNSGQKFLIAVETPDIYPPGRNQGLAAFELKLLGAFDGHTSVGVMKEEGDYFAGSLEFQMRAIGPSSGSTSPIPLNRITIRRSSGTSPANVWCYLAGIGD